MQAFTLPDLGEGMQEAEIRRWLVKPGDAIRLDQPMVEVETDKAVVEIPSPVAGTIAEIYVEAGRTAKLGEVLVTFETSMSTDAAKAAPVVQNAPAPNGAASVVASRSRVPAAPAVRQRAFELGIDLAQVTPSQANGRVTMEDVLAYAKNATGEVASAPATVSAPSIPAASSTVAAPRVQSVNGTISAGAASTDERRPLVGLRKRIAEHMERSWRTVPHAVAFDELDGTELVALRHALKPLAEQRGIRLTYMPLLIKLLLSVLKEFPVFNASLDEERREIIYKRSYHIGIAANSPEGLLVPVLRNADQLSIAEIARQLEHLIEGAQQRTLTLSEVSGSTFTLNNIGSFGGSSGMPIINYPEVAILATGRLQEKAVVRDGAVLVRTMLPLTLSFDHRVIDGVQAGAFLARFKELVEYPQQLMLDML
jgi:pyruvate dehydrogenase E2 component (dihydrolipoamide acetyltransferase)